MTESNLADRRVSVPWDEMRAFENVADEARYVRRCLEEQIALGRSQWWISDALKRLGKAIDEQDRVVSDRSMQAVLDANLAVVPTPPRTREQMAALATQQEWSL